VDISHEELECPRLPELLRQYNVKKAFFKCVFKCRFDKTITDKLLESTKGRVVWDLGDRLSTLKLLIPDNNLVKY
jgi:hypothetical protein